MGKDLNISHNTIKVLEANMGRKISDISCSNIFTDMSPRSKDIKERTNKWDFIKMKSFCMAKENINQPNTGFVWYLAPWFDLQNIERTHMTPLQEDKQSN